RSPPARHSFPTRRSSDLGDCDSNRLAALQLRGDRRDRAFPWTLCAADRLYARSRDRVCPHGTPCTLRVFAHDRYSRSLGEEGVQDRKSTRLNSSHVKISY